MTDSLAKQFAEVIDLSNVFSKNFLDKLKKDLVQAGVEVDAGEYASFSLFATFFLALVLSIAFFLVLSNALLALAFFSAFFAFAFFFLIKHPALKKKKRAELIERDLAVALRTISIKLNSGTPFEKALKEVSAGYGEFSKEIKRVLKNVGQGESVNNALKAFGERVDSLLVKRVCMQLCFVYERGARGEGLRKLADDLVGVQRMKSREFNAKLVFFSLLFIAVSCIVPALFSAYVTVGSSFMQLGFGSTEILLAFCLLFPLLDVAVLFYLREKTPKILYASA